MVSQPKACKSRAAISSGRLNVVVGIQHDGRCVVGSVEVSDDGGPAAFSDDLHVEAFGAKQAGDCLRARLHVCLVEGCQRDAGDPRERFEVLAQSGQELGDPCPKSDLSGGVQVWGKNVVGHDRERTQLPHYDVVSTPCALTRRIVGVQTPTIVHRRSPTSVRDEGSRPHDIQWAPCLDARRPPRTAPRRQSPMRIGQVRRTARRRLGGIRRRPAPAFQDKYSNPLAAWSESK